MDTDLFDLKMVVPEWTRFQQRLSDIELIQISAFFSFLFLE